MKKIRLIKLSASISVFLLLFSCGENEVEQAEVIRPVRFQKVFSTGISRTRGFSGVAQAGQESRLSFKVAGTIRNVAVRVGERVRKGKLIAELNPQDYLLRAQQARDGLNQAEAQERNASANYGRIRGLYENNNASRSDLDAARSASEAAKAAVSGAHRVLDMAELSFSYTKLTAPVNGAIATTDVEVNENVAAGQVVAILTSGARIEVTVGIPEMLIAEIREGNTVAVRFNAVPDKTFEGTITEVAVSTTGALPTYPVTVRLNRENSDIRPGMASDVEFTFDSQDGRERFLVPSNAVGEDAEGRFTFIVVPEGQGTGIVHRKNVTIGELTEDGIEILEGISDGDLVVTAGISKISSGLKVRLLDAKEK